MDTPETEEAATESVPPEGRRPRRQLEQRLLLALALLYTVYFAKTLLMPIVAALFFALLLSPPVEFLKRFFVPRSLSALLMLCLIGGPLGLLATQLADPAQRWAREIPKLADQLSERMDDLTKQLAPEEPEADVKDRGFNFFGLLDKDEEEEKPDAGNGVTEKLKQSSIEAVITVMGAAPLLVAQLLTAAMLTLFLLIFGSGLYATWARVFLSDRDRERSIRLMSSVQEELSRYILTVSVINSGLGIVVAGTLFSLGVEDALLWGVLVAILNFAPYLGPLIGVLVLSLAGVAQYGIVPAALLPALVYFAINMLEAQVVTPLILGRNMRLNPLVIIVWLVTWGWLWGTVGVLLAVPMLVCIKIAAGQTQLMSHWLELIEARPT